MKVLLSQRQLIIYVVDIDKICKELSTSFANLQVLTALLLECNTTLHCLCQNSIIILWRKSHKYIDIDFANSMLV